MPNSSLTPFRLRKPQYDYMAKQKGGPGIIYVGEATGMDEWDGTGFFRVTAVKDPAFLGKPGYQQGDHGPFKDQGTAERYAKEHVNDPGFWTTDTSEADIAALPTVDGIIQMRRE